MIEFKKPRKVSVEHTFGNCLYNEDKVFRDPLTKEDNLMEMRLKHFNFHSDLDSDTLEISKKPGFEMLAKSSQDLLSEFQLDLS